MTQARRIEMWIFAALLVAVAAALLLPGTARAKSVSYQEPTVNGDGSVTFATKTADNAEEVTSETKALVTGYYYVSGSVVIGDTLDVSRANASLILEDGCELTVKKGITVGNGGAGSSSLNIFGQAGGTGRLIATGSGGAAGIRVPEGGNLTVNGASVTAIAENNLGDEAGDGAGIGGSGQSGDYSSAARNCGTVTIYGGRVTASSNGDGAGIGGSGGNSVGRGGAVTINGGTVVAWSAGFGAGIGSGARSGSSAQPGGAVKVSNAAVTALSAGGGPGIGGSGGTLSVGNNSVVVAGGMYQGVCVDSLTKSNCILVDNHKGELCGTVRIPVDVKTSPDQSPGNFIRLIAPVSLEIPADGELVIPSGMTLDNAAWNIKNKGKVTIENGGTLKLESGIYDAALDNTDGEFVNNGGTIEGTRPGSGITRVHVSGVSLFSGTLPLNPGKSYKLTESVEPQNATNKAVSWQSDCPRVASVDSTGIVTANAGGTAKITVTTEDGNMTASCMVTVAETSAQPQPATYTVTYRDGVRGQVFQAQEHGNLQSGNSTPGFSGSVPSREGYVFSGWSPEVATTVTANAVYTAMWETDPASESEALTAAKAAQNAAEQAKAKAEQELDVANSAKADAERLKGEAESKAQTAEARANRLQEDVTELQRNLFDVQNEAATAQKNLQDVQARLTAAEEARDRAVKERDDALQRAAEAGAGGSGLQVQVDALQKSLADAENRASAAQRDLQDAEARVAAAEKAQESADAAHKAARAAQKAAEDALKAAQSGAALDREALAETLRVAEEAQAKADAAQASADEALASLSDALKQAEVSAASEQAALERAERREAELKAALSAYASNVEEVVRVASAKPAKLKAGARKGGRAVLSWKGPKGVKGLSWQIGYRKAGASTWKTKKSSKSRLSLKGLKTDKVYVFKVRGYKKVAGKTVRTAWSGTVRACALA